MAHTCPAEGCDRQVPTEQLACKSHWYRVTPATRRRVWSAYQHGTDEQHHAAILQAIAEMNAPRGAR